MTFTREQLKLATLLAEMVVETYPGGTLTPNVVDDATDTQVYVGQLPDGRPCVLFPGTASRRDVLTDIFIIKARWSPGYVHAGARAAWRAVEDRVLELLPPRTPIVFAGHSLGGGLAQVAADTFMPSRVAQVITYGSLRVFNGAAADAYDASLGARTWRFVNQGDPVPCLPLPLPIPRSGIYTHTAGEIYLPEAGGIDTARPWYATALPLCTAASSLLLGKLNPALLDVFSVPAHFMVSYIARLKTLAA